MATAFQSWTASPASPPSSSWLGDWWQGVADVGTWLPLAWYDIHLRYRRSILGPWWLTISMGMMLLGLGPLYAVLFKSPVNSFYPSVAIGLIIWTFMSATLQNGTSVFTNAAGTLKNSATPLSLIVCRGVARDVIQLLHHLVLYVPFAIWAGIDVTPVSLLVVPALALLIFNMHAGVTTLGIACARFHDVGPIVTSLMTFMTFLTPVIWVPDSLPTAGRFVLDFPFASWLTIVREPLLGRLPSLHSWGVAVGWTVVNAVIAAAVFAWKRRQIVYWV
ncbi:MAG: ABC transporter permease [Planctomycetia bacterium]|nr:ABC transporter permease [Planctomycetia bacterium]